MSWRKKDLAFQKGYNFSFLLKKTLKGISAPLGLSQFQHLFLSEALSLNVLYISSAI